MSYTPPHFPSPTPNTDGDGIRVSMYRLDPNLLYHAVAMVRTAIGMRYGLARPNSYDIKCWVSADETVPGVVDTLYHFLASSPDSHQTHMGGALAGVNDPVVEFFLNLM
ncbi:hypothetical protein K439DRAFT_1624616 [Ramaria rubella]|nr:hypothetical protein K439DRAFT_1624616 [Ramaria rubella]